MLRTRVFNSFPRGTEQPVAFLLETTDSRIIAQNNCSDYNNGSLRTAARDDSFRTGVWRTDFSPSYFEESSRYFVRYYQTGNNTFASQKFHIFTDIIKWPIMSYDLTRHVKLKKYSVE